MKDTGTPMLGLPPVPSGDVAFFLVRGALGIGAHYVARDPIMGIIIPMKAAIDRRAEVWPRIGGRRQSKGQGLTAYR